MLPTRIFPLLGILILTEFAMAQQSRLLFIGTQTRLGGKGIYSLAMDASTGALGEAQVAVECENPTFIARHPSKDFLYAVAEVANRDGGGAVSAFRVEPGQARLSPLNTVGSGGKGPCFVSVDGGGRWAFSANYGSGALAALPILPDGSLGSPSSVIQDEGKGAHPKRQSGPHAHSIKMDPTGRYAFACDLGIDRVLSFKIDPTGPKLVANDPSAFVTHPGAGPRHFSFHPSGKWVVIANELDTTVTFCRYDGEKGLFTELASVPALPKEIDATNNSLSEIAFHPTGKFFYAANRGHDSIAVFETGDPTLPGYAPRLIEAIPCGGKVPRHFALSPDGRFLVTANQNSGNLAVLAVDAATGRLKPTAVSVALPGASCVLFY